ncbi:uncharacterized protein FRV6_05176 [Fusarium oxysporum]|uniref:Uncharacterized protein n=1 Tax=Fusarium oxysporum TaxID=5507 RepID=A0A2H3TGS2_FUSOX|nr:uncharacterized protein FRV6_05176 [Fusarium oxysporum]
MFEKVLQSAQIFTKSSQSVLNKQYDDRIKDWLLDSGLDVQQRLLTGGYSQREPTSLPPTPRKTGRPKTKDPKAKF